MAKGFFGPPIEQRLWSRVDIKGPTDCWIWLGSPRKGYGHIKKQGQRVSSATHRVAWELTYGVIPDGLFVCHKCDNKRCCNPNHLFIGTPQENTLDMYNKKKDPTSNGTRYQPNVSGEKNGRAKLTLKDVDLIRSNKGSISSKDLASQFSVSVSTICRVISGSQWKK